MAVLYYFPGATGSADKHLHDAGLGELVPAGEPGPQWADVLQGGPDGGRGMLCGWLGQDPAHSPRLGLGHSIHWHKARPDKAAGLPAGRYWLGIEADRPATPTSLQRKQRFAGCPVRLKDGQEWIVPIAHQLPHQHGLDEAGNFARVIDEPYRWFWEESERYARCIFDELDAVDFLEARGKRAAGQVSIRLADAWAFCSRVLALNYRLHADLIDRLGLLDDAAMLRLIAATIELPEIQQLRGEKKKPADSRLVIPVS